MVVRTLSAGREVTGLYIGTRNARRNFPRSMDGVELQLGHLHIHCELAPEFWRDRPEICDRRLGDWLAAKIFHGGSRRAPAPVAMIRKGKNVYKVQPFTLPPASTNGLSRIGPVTAPAADGKANLTVSGSPLPRPRSLMERASRAVR